MNIKKEISEYQRIANTTVGNLSEAELRFYLCVAQGNKGCYIDEPNDTQEQPQILIDTVLQHLKTSSTLVIARLLIHLFTQNEKYAINLVDFSKLDLENLNYVMAIINHSARHRFKDLLDSEYLEKMRQVIEIYGE